MSVIEITKNNFQEEVLKSDKKVLVDFWAEWCGPCRMLGPTIEELAEKIDDVKFAKLNVDEEIPVALKYRVSSIPCLILFEDGKEVKRSVGLIPKEEVLEFIK